MGRVSHKSLFNKLRNSEVISRSEQFAFWTLPQLMVDQSDIAANQHGTVAVERDYQEMGPLLVNNLAPKLCKLLFPTVAPFFRVNASEEFKLTASAQGISDMQLTAAFASAEIDAVKRLFLNATYAQLVLALKHLIVTGNVLLHRDSAKSKCIAYGVQSYVTRRAGDGTLLDCVLREYTFVEALPPSVQEVLKAKNRQKYSREECPVELYTRIHRELKGGNVIYAITEEVDDVPVGDVSEYPEHLCPYIAATWNLLPGEHFGRGLVEDFSGGFAKLSDVSESQALYIMEAMKVVHMVDPASGADIDDIANAECGEYVRGSKDAVTVMESGDAGKVQEATNILGEVYRRLATAFMYGGNTRDGERVTALEIQLQAQEVETTLGGAYSSLSACLQTPLAHILLVEVRGTTLPALTSGTLKVDIEAGIPALGRSTSVQNLIAATQDLSVVATLSQIDPRFDIQRITDLVLQGRSISPDTVLYNEQEQQANAQAKAQEMQGMQQLQASSTAARTLQDMEGVQAQ